MNFGEMKTEVTRRLRDPSTSTVFWSDTDVATAINDGLMELSDATEWYETYSVLSLLSSQIYYDLRTVLSDTILSPKCAFNQTTNIWLTPVCIRDLDYQTYREWETITGEPEKMFMRGLWWLGLFPKASADDTLGSLKLYFSAIPPAMDDDTDELDIPEEFQIALIEYALFDLLAQDKETKEALRHWVQYAALEERFRRYVGDRLALDRVHGYV
jgi:hypothetical protein